MAETRTRSTRRSAGTGSPGRDARREDTGAVPEEHVCPVAFCPIGMALTAVNRTNPEVLEHLMAAARELFLAVRTVVDVRAEDLGGSERSTELERIEIA